MAMLVSCIFRKYSEEEEDDVAKAKLADDEELVQVPAVDLSEYKTMTTKISYSGKYRT